jgi:hypothetical protein
MKRLISVLCCVTFLFSFVGCTNENADYTEHQDLEKNEISFFDDALHFDLKEAGLTNVFIRDMCPSSALVGDDLYARVYLVGDDRYRGNMSTSDHYLMLIIEDKIILEDLKTGNYNARLGGRIEVEDFDGDGYKEILVQEAADMFGGYGQHISRVYKYDDGQIKTIFSAFTDNEHRFDTGFSCTVLEDYNLKIQNKYTGYEEIFNYRDARKTWYGEKDCTHFDTKLLVDSFYDFKPMDVDDDGVCEVIGYQYTSLNGHTDYVGSAKTVLKYDKKKSEFVVVDAEFIRCDSKPTQEKK